ncbi:hypothetical protein NYZ99_03425 [Maribacter litopenaei]|uniref:Outer membrane protein beta-barrel domain-containing protein n=1 Tax=Maribacter litopenaei TaxID=2976127 RepID=A0ABY5Y931_9FLAO|nr:hypothetical protein [Maribacter litopenaei]UWX55555.1 hypothetical protein NYZ99_03425 [Maribacter litopenaei]
MKTWVNLIFILVVTSVLAQNNLVYMELGGNGGIFSLNYERSFPRAGGIALRAGLGISFFEFEKESVNYESTTQCLFCGIFTDLPRTSFSLPMSVHYPIDLKNGNYLEVGLGSTWQLSKKSLLVQYGSLFFRRHFGENRKWIWKVGLTPILGVIGENVDKSSEPTLWYGISIGRRF